MASSTHKQHHHLPNPYGATTAPPPTPSTSQPNPQSSSDSADVLSRLLHRLPPTLSLPTRRFPPTTDAAAAVSPPLISLSPQSQNPTELLSAASELGFFQLTNHSVPPQLARSAESDSTSLFSLPREQKPLLFPKNWPLGFDGDEDDVEGENGANESFCLDSACSTESTELSISSLREFTREMEKVGMEVVEALSCAVGFENPARDDPTRVCSLMWISNGTNPGASGRLYPYVVGLEYQIRCQKYSLLSDSGWVSVSPQVGSILVTLGDIAQVWSNGKIKKVRGRAVPDVGAEVENAQLNKHGISMCLVVSLPLESSVSPLLTPRLTKTNNDPDTVGVGDNGQGEEEDNKDDNAGGNAAAAAADAFLSFSFEDYAWRVYHERLLLKDPLDRYRII